MINITIGYRASDVGFRDISMTIGDCKNDSSYNSMVADIKAAVARISYAQQKIEQTAQEFGRISHSVKYDNLQERMDQLCETIKKMGSCLKGTFHQAHMAFDNSEKIKEIDEQIVKCFTALQENLTGSITMIKQIHSSSSNINNIIGELKITVEKFATLAQADQESKNKMYSDVLNMKSTITELSTKLSNLENLEKKIVEAVTKGLSDLGSKLASDGKTNDNAQIMEISTKLQANNQKIDLSNQAIAALNQKIDMLNAKIQEISATVLIIKNCNSNQSNNSIASNVNIPLPQAPKTNINETKPEEKKTVEITNIEKPK